MLAACAASISLTACSGIAGAPYRVPDSAVASISPMRVRPAQRIDHVVIIVQENRTFENVFAGYPHADAPMFGFESNGRKLRLQPISFKNESDMVHNFTQAVTAWHKGAMDRFDRTPLNDGDPAGTYPYSYLRRNEVGPYWTLAQRYVLADHMFPLEFGPSFTSHLSLIAATTTLSPGLAEANYPFAQPWGCDQRIPSPTFTVNLRRKVNPNGPGPCFTQFRTMADTLDAAGVSWRYYAPTVFGESGGQLWSSFDAINNVRFGPDWKRNVVSPQTRVLRDARLGQLAALSWVIPDWHDSDHPAASSPTGPSWVASVVNAIGQGPQWKSTAIFVVWDDWGGWYDNAPPPQRDFRGLGIRVPLIVISPYARTGYVDHTQYEFGSILRFAEEALGLPPIGPESAGYTDSRAPRIEKAFDFAQRPRRFTPIPDAYPAEYFERHAPSGRPPDTE